MDAYTALVSRILKNPLLAGVAEELTRYESMREVQPPPLNLVCPDWHQRLQNDVAFQDCKTQSAKDASINTTNEKYDYASYKRPYLNVTVVGNCRFIKPFDSKKQTENIVVSECEPLRIVARTIMNDLGPQIDISDEFKFVFEECSQMSCDECMKSYAFFDKKGYSIQKVHQPCICATRIYDGKRVMNRFHSQMVRMFPQSFVGIVHLRINARYNFNDSNKNKIYRIGGVVTGIVGFTEAKLSAAKSIDLGDFPVAVPPEEEVLEPRKKPSESGVRKEPGKPPVNMFEIDADALNDEGDAQGFFDDETCYGKRPHVEQDQMSMDQEGVPGCSGAKRPRTIG